MKSLPVGAKIVMVVNVDWFFLSHRLPVALALKNKGLNVTIAAADTGEAGTIRKHGLSFIELPELESNYSTLNELEMVSLLAKLYNRTKPDLVHHVTIRPVLYGNIAARIAGVPAVINALSGLGYVYTHNTLKNRMLQAIFDRLFRIGFRHPNSKLILQNRDDVELFTRKNLLPAENIRVIKGSGVDTELFRPNSTGNKTMKVALPGRMLWDKGVKEFVEAGKIVEERGVKIEFHLFGAPYVNNPMSIPMEQIGAWQKYHWLYYHGQKEEMARELRNIDIVCLPSYREGLPKSLLEAASAGKPIITTSVPGCREIVEDGLNGFLIPPKNSRMLAEKIIQLAENKNLRDRFGEAGREKVLNEFTDDIVINQTINLYKELLS